VRNRWTGRAERALLAAALLPILALPSSCVVDHHARGAAPVGTAVPWTLERCRAAEDDRDADGVDDECELALARAFAPELVVDPRDCSWDGAARPPRLGAGYVFAVETTRDARAIRIAFLPAYYRDCGWQGLPCITRGRGCSAHDGDSEIIVVEAHYDSAAVRWVTDAIFLSAHCFGRSAGRCRWYSGASLPHFTWTRGIQRAAPRIWVARGKHANYPSSRECDTGHWYYDSCDGNSVAYRFPIQSSSQNIGSRRRPLPRRDAAVPEGCINAAQLPLRSSAIELGTHECFWDRVMPFRGWQHNRGADASTSYSRVLGFAAGF
jgi:hypothetical protein